MKIHAAVNSEIQSTVYCNTSTAVTLIAKYRFL
jgi:hypothetical protein